MKNEILSVSDSFSGFEVSFTQGRVEIAGYNQIHAALSELADYLEHVEVTEENIKENKKLVARVSKATKEMNQARIDYKKRYLEPFSIYEGQVKELTELVKTAEDTVRAQIRELDEIEREEKEQKIKKLFERRKRPYKEYGQFMNFEDFIEPRHLNKSTSMNSVEEEITNWIEGVNNDLALLANLSKRDELNFYDAVVTYLENHDVTKTIDYYITKDEKKKEVEQKIVEAKKTPPRGVKREYVNVIIEKEVFTDKVEPMLQVMGVEYQCC